MMHKYRRVVDLCCPYLRPGDTLLDYGSGTGRLAGLIRDACRVQVTGADVTDYRETDIPVVVYDGSRLPFGDRTFDVSLAAFVLHHHTDPETGVRELRRVTRRRVLVVEDAWTHWMNWWWLYLVEYVANRWHSLSIPLPYQFQEPDAWIQLFHDHGFRIVTQREFRSGLIWHVLFVLEPGTDLGERARERSRQSASNALDSGAPHR